MPRLAELDLLFPKKIGRTDPSAAFAAAAQGCLTSFSKSKLEEEIMGPLGVLVPKKAGLLVRSLDCTINTWDLARSIGVEPGVDPAVPGALMDFASGFLPKVREKTATLALVNRRSSRDGTSSPAASPCLAETLAGPHEWQLNYATMRCPSLGGSAE